MINFKNKKIIITGATGGIGYSLVKTFVYLRSLLSNRSINIFIEIYVHIIQKHKKGISLGLKRPCPNKYG